MMKNALVILAGGKGKRFGQKIPKQFLKFGNTNFLNYFISKLDLANFDIVNISIDKKYQNTYLNHKVVSEKITITYSKPGNRTCGFRRKFPGHNYHIVIPSFF